MTRILFAALLFLAPGSARAVETVSPSQAYQDVMRAQYAARQASPPISAEEAQRIYDAYLKTIGQPARQRPSGLGADATLPSR